MKTEPKLYEQQLYEIWKNQCFTSELHTKSGDEIKVLDVGSLNIDYAGADFKNARIRVGNLTYVGDIEIDVDYNNWKSHGHNIDSKYNKVILHISFFNKHKQPFVYTKDGRKIHSICISPFLHESFKNQFGKEVESKIKRKENSLKCSFFIENIARYQKEKFISDLGIVRFKRKCDRIYKRLKELKFLQEHNIKEPVIRYDLTEAFQKRVFTHEDFKTRDLWEQLLYEMLFEALGYSKNKTIMLHLAQSANLEFLRKLGNDSDFLTRIESALFNIGGLIPNVEELPEEGTSAYTKKLAAEWELLKRIYDGKTFDETQWHFFKLRPQNFPTVRIAGGTRILKKLMYGGLIEIMIKKIREIRHLPVLVNSLRSLYVIKSEGFWQKHYIFDKPSSGDIKYFVGASRADEMVINVILPFFSIYFDIFGDEAMAKKILMTYNIYNQNAENKIVRDVAESLEMTSYLKKTVYQQGMIELFRNYCSKGKCLECKIGKVAFN
jgi:hypothetical protein